jgi:broad specificity phosphatase PhoE
VTLLLLRHGESEGNVLRMIQGWRDYPLTERGHRQAACAADRLATSGAVALYASPLRRAADTARAVARTTGLEVQETPDFREYHFGAAEGMRWNDAARRWGLADRDWGVGRVPGEEGMEAFRARVSRQFEALHARHRDEIAICVLHAGTVGALIEELCGLPLHEHVALYTGNCGISVIGDANGTASVVTLNDQRHIPAELR